MAVAVKLSSCPEQAGLLPVFCDTLTEGVNTDVTETITALLSAVAVEAQVLLDTTTQLTLLLLASVAVVNVGLLLPTGKLFTSHW